MDPIIASIDAVLGTCENVPEISARLQHSAEFQRLNFAHLSRFLTSELPVPDRIALIVAHCTAIGYETGRAVATAERMEALFA